MEGCFVLLRRCGGSSVSALIIFAGGGAGDCGAAVLKMAASCLSAVVLFYPRCGMGLDCVGFCQASVRSAAALVTISAYERFGKLFWTRKSSSVSDTCSDAVLGM